MLACFQTRPQAWAANKPSTFLKRALISRAISCPNVLIFLNFYVLFIKISARKNIYQNFVNKRFHVLFFRAEIRSKNNVSIESEANKNRRISYQLFQEIRGVPRNGSLRLT